MNIKWTKAESGMWNFDTNPTVEGKITEIIPANPGARTSSIFTLDGGDGDEIKFYGCTVIDRKSVV